MVTFEELVKKGQERHSKALGAFTNLMSYLGDLLKNENNKVADILCGHNVSMFYQGLGLIGSNGELILIDAREDFPYKIVTDIAGKDFLPETEEYYIKTQEGKEKIRKILSSVRATPYVAKIPPYPKEIIKGSLDAVTCVNSLFEFVGDRKKLMKETTQMLKPKGYFLAQEWFFNELQRLFIKGEETIARNYDLITAKDERMFRSKWAIIQKRETPRTEEEAMKQCWVYDLDEVMEELTYEESLKSFNI